MVRDAKSKFVQARPAAKLCMVRLLKELALNAAALAEIPQLLGSCVGSSREAAAQVLSRLQPLTRRASYSSLPVCHEVLGLKGQDAKTCMRLQALRQARALREKHMNISNGNVL